MSNCTAVKHRSYMTYLKVLSDLTDETLERQLADEQLGGLLVATNFTESDGTRAEPVRLLHTTGSSLESVTNTKGKRNNKEISQYI